MAAGRTKRNDELQARTGEAKPWWHWTAERKRRMALGDFNF